jgi:hypothetical protein
LYIEYHRLNGLIYVVFQEVRLELPVLPEQLAQLEIQDWQVQQEIRVQLVRPEAPVLLVLREVPEQRAQLEVLVPLVQQG